MKRIVLLSGILLLATAVSQPVQDQILKGFGKKLEKKIENRIERKADRHVDKVLDKADKKTDEPIDDALNGKKGKKENQKNDKGNTDALQTADGNGMGEIGKNYDFIPGERTIFKTDFSDATVGNFPRNLEFRGGELSVVSYSGGRAIAANTKGSFAIMLPEKLPERFTIEFNEFNSDYVNSMRVDVVDANFKPVGQHYIRVDGYSTSTGVDAYKRGDVTSLQNADIINKEMTPIRVMVDGTYVKVYVGTKRVANMPNANLGRSNTILFNFDGVRSKPVYVADIRIAAGGRSLYQALEATGRVAIHDIHFATGKADILPESSETIGDMAKLLQDHPDLKLLIEGHTDNTGDFQKNMQLSKDRAAAVKSYLIGKFNIDQGRLETMGMGQSRPTATNDTEEGKAENRRVEIVKM